jgi:sulfite exporter TauE/SafE
MNFAPFDPLYSACGFVGGLLVGMTGVGGGSLMTPLLILLFGVPPATAVGTDLLYAAATKTGGSLVHGLAGRIEWIVVRRLATGSVPSTVVTLLVLSHFDVKGAAVRDLMTAVLSFALFVTAGLLIFRNLVLAFARAHVTEFLALRTARLTVLSGVLARRAGIDLLGWRWRHRRHISRPALPPASSCEDRRLRYRPRRSLNASRWDGPLDAGFGGLANIWLTPDGLIAGHSVRQLSLSARRGTCPPDRSCPHAHDRRRQARSRADPQSPLDFVSFAHSVRQRRMT